MTPVVFHYLRRRRRRSAPGWTLRVWWMESPPTITTFSCLAAAACTATFSRRGAMQSSTPWRTLSGKRAWTGNFLCCKRNAMGTVMADVNSDRLTAAECIGAPPQNCIRSGTLWRMRNERRACTGELSCFSRFFVLHALFSVACRDCFILGYRTSRWISGLIGRVLDLRTLCQQELYKSCVARSS